MSSAKQAFASLTNKLRDAFAAGDWEAITVLDAECRALVARLGQEDALDVQLRDELAGLSRLYDEIQQAGRTERERLAEELKRLNQSKHVNQAYKSLG
ncbi:flagellar protein FliT [Stutzerimonas zhaodongensis]|uniref:flagellar protein FliT n=1 Tax=Stutzerimonas TaxID=2901164 RepID=UPI00388DBC24